LSLCANKDAQHVKRDAGNDARRDYEHAHGEGCVSRVTVTRNHYPHEKKQATNDSTNSLDHASKTICYCRDKISIFVSFH